MDRFAMRFALGYLDLQDEMNVLADQFLDHPIADVRPCIAQDEVAQLNQYVKQVRISDELRQYMVQIVQATRTAEGVAIGASPRASLALMKTAQAIALFDGNAFVVPEHVQEVAVPVVAHRLVMEPQARFAGITSQQLVDDVLKQIPVPA
jgi:MoxR-like ATPase